jgi:tetratricopeptide (TPR) repeat protein
LLCIVIAGVVRAVRRPAAEDEAATVSAANPTNLDGDVQHVVEVGNRLERKSTRQVALDAIAGHKAKIAEDPNHREVPAYQLAIANLHIFKLGDYESAASELEELISRSPESNLAAQAYAKLGKCYESLGWSGVADATYKRMERHFPEGSGSWEYARAKQRGKTMY